VPPDDEPDVPAPPEPTQPAHAHKQSDSGKSKITTSSGAGRPPSTQFGSGSGGAAKAKETAPPPPVSAPAPTPALSSAANAKPEPDVKAPEGGLKAKLAALKLEDKPPEKKPEPSKPAPTATMSLASSMGGKQKTAASTTPRDGDKSEGVPELQRKASNPKVEQPKAETTAAAKDTKKAEDGKKQLPPGWIEATDPRGRKYFYNKATKTTQWDFPTDETTTTTAPAQTTPKSEEPSPPRKHSVADSPLPAGWEALTDPSGKPYYYNRSLKKTQWSRPTPEPEADTAAPPPPPATAEPPLPAGWVEASDP
jgi:hypothetical protein